VRVVEGVPVWGEPLADAVAQMRNVARRAEKVALMADHHLGYAVPIGGVVAYEEHVSPSGVGYDIACGNKAVLTDMPGEELRRRIAPVMDGVFASLSFGIGRRNEERVDHPLLHDDPAWDVPAAAALRDLAGAQLGTIGSGNHYVDLFTDEIDRVWIGVHFGSRGLGHRLATHFIKAGGGRDGMNVDPVVLRADSELGREYVACMKLAGRYAYAGRDWVCARVARLLGARILEEVHNHHNFAWREEHGGRPLWVVRKGATPCFPGQRSFIGGTMAEGSVIVEGVDSPENEVSLCSTVHGAGRVISRTRAAGKARWRDGRKIRVTPGEISREQMEDWVRRAGVELRGAGTDESPHCYKRLENVLAAHRANTRVVHRLRPVGVAMAAEGEHDPFRD
jgi:tRNA-splicing ligase RtcB